MNEEALKDAYGLFTQSGYNGTQDEFYTLLSENAEAFADSYGLFKNSGYNGSEDEYKNLLGLKKKTLVNWLHLLWKRLKRVLRPVWFSKILLQRHQ